MSDSELGWLRCGNYWGYCPGVASVHGEVRSGHGWLRFVGGITHRESR
jgi:hypothetical protein